ncbi:M28 family peptidase [Tahibacter sp.]|uniref:M28 family metallopeptidase n=1 Tax=Tahibacter sp. TaxID=2056211 RepID=UPI0028C41C12|nr:M28 family peptidase [Tahibacter sp.]
MLPVLGLLLALPAAAPQDHAVVLDIRTASAVDVEQFKHGVGVRWWVELGTRLVVGGEAASLRTLAVRGSRLGEIEAIDKHDLALRTVGCALHEEAPGQLLVQSGRWQLRRLPPGMELPPSQPGHETWRRLGDNDVLARQYRLDAPLGAMPDPLVLPLVDQIDAARWFGDVTQLASWDRSSYGTTSLNASRDWIGVRMQGLGLAVTTPGFSMPGAGSGSITRQNVIGTWTGTSMPNEWIVVGAHYDSRNSSGSSVTNTPGAEDNASGCAGVIELARALLPFKPRRSILFMCYAGEEQGLYGSTRHVQALQSSGDLAKVKSVVIMDMIGYSADNQLDALYESKSAYLSYLNRFGAAAAAYVPALNVTISTNPFGSDHMPYLDANKETVLAIESDWASYPHYHRSTDTPANMGVNAQAMGGAILKTNVAVLAELSGASDRIFADIDK